MIKKTFKDFLSFRRKKSTLNYFMISKKNLLQKQIFTLAQKVRQFFVYHFYTSRSFSILLSKEKLFIFIMFGMKKSLRRNKNKLKNNYYFDKIKTNK